MFCNKYERHSEYRKCEHHITDKNGEWICPVLNCCIVAWDKVSCRDFTWYQRFPGNYFAPVMDDNLSLNFDARDFWRTWFVLRGANHSFLSQAVELKRQTITEDLVMSDGKVVKDFVSYVDKEHGFKQCEDMFLAMLPQITEGAQS